MIMVGVAIAILAVDFPPIFERSLCKTEEYGISLMDTGVALITLLSGMSSRKARPWIETRSCFEVLKDMFESSLGVIFSIYAGTYKILTAKAADY